MQNFIEHFPFLFLALEVLYFAGIALVIARVITDTQTSSKALAYILLIVFLPIVGVVIYFTFGINYRKNRFYRFKIEKNEAVMALIQKGIESEHDAARISFPDYFDKYTTTIEYLYQATSSPLTRGNHVELLINGEEKFPKVIDVLKNAKDHIHLEYYIFQSDKIGQQIGEILKKKAKEGLEVRLLYDAFGSNQLKKNFIRELQESGVEVAPVNSIRFRFLANRINYRDHRKIIIVDGEHVFTGGINVCEKYINPNNSLYWRDTHIYLKGNAAFFYQALFISNWMFANEKMLEFNPKWFKYQQNPIGEKVVQVATSGPDTKPSIMLSTTSSIYAAKKRIYITTPYFIPNDTVLDAIKQQSFAGIDVRILVPQKGDSLFVNAAAYSYYQELLECGARVYFYKKGFVHAKTMVIDDDFSCVGTANMDVRSQELNFEVNTHVYSQETNALLSKVFFDDLKFADEVNLKEWKERSKSKVFFEHLSRLMSPLM